MKKIAAFFVFLAFLGCDNKDESILCTNYDTTVSFSVLNVEGQDLLNPDNSNHLDMSEIKIFYVINGKTEEFNGSEKSRRFQIHKNDFTGMYEIEISLNYLSSIDKTITYIQWYNKNVDILESTFTKMECLTTTKQVWLNGKLVWDYSKNDGIHPVVIVK